VSARVRAEYKPDRESFGTFMMSEQARGPAIEAAKDIVAALAAGVHRGTGNGGKNGHLADSYKVNREAAPIIFRGNPRVGADVYSEHPGAAPEEFGGRGPIAGNQAAKHWLTTIAAPWHVPKGA
jgi:hypothetical protein